jgi:hypothetical protein
VDANVSDQVTMAYAELGQFDEAWPCINEAMTEIEGTKERRNEGTKERRNEGTKERRNEGTKERRNDGGRPKSIARPARSGLSRSPEPDAAKAEVYFELRSQLFQQQAKSWELRAAMSMARFAVTSESHSKLGNCLRRPTTGSPKASIRATSKSRRCSMSYRNGALDFSYWRIATNSHKDLTSAFGAKGKWAGRQSSLPRSKMTHLRHRVLLVWAPWPASLAGQEHGRTIPLVDNPLSKGRPIASGRILISSAPSGCRAP